MDTAESILRKHVPLTFITNTEKRKIQVGMDEHAENMASEFAEWCSNNARNKDEAEAIGETIAWGEWIYAGDGRHLQTRQLYRIFLEQMANR